MSTTTTINTNDTTTNQREEEKKAYLFADKDNLISNRVYQKVGFEINGEFVLLEQQQEENKNENESKK